MTVRAVAALVLTSICGCEPPAASTAAKSAPPPPPAVGVQVAEVTVSAERPPDALAPEEQPVEAPAPAEPTETPTEPASASEPAQPTEPTPAAPRQSILRLSAGVALPQLLPEGTQIGVSVDYKVTGRLNPSARYALVVDSSAGQIAVPVELSPQGGTIQGFLPIAVRPEHKPFRARLDEFAPGSRSGTPVSNRLDLQTSY